MAPASLVVAIHMHQPSGADPAELAERFAQRYGPILDALAATPLRAALHISGPLWSHAVESEPGFLEKVERLVQTERVELVASGLGEPAWPLIADWDVSGQLSALRVLIREHTGQEPGGLWLGGDLWDPELPRLLVPQGVRFAFIDAAQLKGEGWRGPVVVERSGVALALFGLLPMPTTTEALTAFFEERGAKTLTGVSVGEQPSLEEIQAFFQALVARAEQLPTERPSAALEHRKPRRVSLEPTRIDGKLPMAAVLSRPEARELYHQALRISRKLAQAEAELGPGAAHLGTARTELFRGQGFEPLLTHVEDAGLRHAAYESLIRAESLIDLSLRGEGDFIEYEEDDLDADLADEALLANAHLTVQIDPEEGGAVTSLVFRDTGTSLSNVLARPTDDAADGYARFSFIDRFPAAELALADLRNGSDGDAGDFAAAPYEIEASGVDEEGDLSASVTLVRESTVSTARGARPLLVEKTFTLPVDAARLEVDYILENRSDDAVSFTFAPELNLALLAGDGTDRYLEHGDQKRPLDDRTGLRDVKRLALVDAWAGLRVTLEIDREAEVWTYPLASEGPPQGHCVLLRFPLSLPPGECARVSITLGIGVLDPAPMA